MGWELVRDTNPCREVTDANIDFWTKITGSEGYKKMVGFKELLTWAPPRWCYRGEHLNTILWELSWSQKERKLSVYITSWKFLYESLYRANVCDKTPNLRLAKKGDDKIFILVLINEKRSICELVDRADNLLKHWKEWEVRYWIFQRSDNI